MDNKIATIPWFGGKYNMLDILLKTFPPHNCYLDLFGGSGVVLANKKRCQLEVYNDRNSNVVDFYRVLQDKTLFKKFKEVLSITPYSRELYNEYKHNLSDTIDIVMKAVKFFVVVRQSFSGFGGCADAKSTKATWAYAISKSNKEVKTWLSAIDKLDTISNRFIGVQIENLDFRNAISRYNNKDFLLYCDPPYVPSTRKSNGEYADNEMEDSDHTELLNLLLLYKGKVVLSGYDCDLYRNILCDWNKVKFNSVCSVSKGKNTKRTECVWTNTATVKNSIKKFYIHGE